MRHAFGTYKASEGVPIERVSKFMGHTNTKTTQRYARLGEGALIDVLGDTTRDR